MSRWRVILLLAAWEFRCNFKWKSQLISWGIALALLLGLASLGPRLMRKTLAETTTVGVVGHTGFPLPSALGVEWKPGEADALRRQARLASHTLDPAVLADVTAPFDLEHVRSTDTTAPGEHEAAPPSRKRSKWDKIMALSVLGFMFGGLFTGTALLFTGITSEKQQLVTEQIVAAVPPQTWIDGKILGNGFRALIGTLELMLWSLVGMAVWGGFVNPEFDGLRHVSPGFLLQVTLLATLGFAMWFCFFAAVAATMALTVRLAFSEVPWWQVALALAGMTASIAVLRRAAGKVFAMASLMRGKEPGWRQMWAAARHSG